MQDNLTQVPVQPFVKLAQANMDVARRFMASAEVAPEATASGSQTVRDAVASMTTMVQSSAFTDMRRGMLGNYTVFLTELSQLGVSAIGRVQAALVRRTGHATATVIEATQRRRRPNAQAA